jgi:predicted transcriptional regulator of viral defense system
MLTEVTGRWEDLVSRPEFCGHRVTITIVDQTSAAPETSLWLEDLRRMASSGVRTSRLADDSRESIYE